MLTLPTPFFPSIPMRLLPLLTVAVWMSVSACNGTSEERRSETAPADSPEDAMTIPFRHDGDLDFVRDGEAYLSIAIEIADTDETRTRGLMQRESLPERSGMLFIFDDEAPRSFWMANTPIALDILFASSDSQIVTIRKYTRPFSAQSVVSEDPAQYVVEVPAGFTDSHGIIEGDRIRWERSN